jgi:3-hydroxyisobutyrate dehydrogenase-like beta-hydroxyacid dehydrogenase
MKLQRIGLIGHGEVGKTFTSGLKDKPGVAAMGAWDLKFADAQTRDAELDLCARHGITAHGSMRELCEASDLVISAVTASNTLAVAQEAAQFIRAGSVFLDLNSASPGT